MDWEEAQGCPRSSITCGHEEHGTHYCGLFMPGVGGTLIRGTQEFPEVQLLSPHLAAVPSATAFLFLLVVSLGLCYLLRGVISNTI